MLAAALTSAAQSIAPDPDFRTGRLENGLTYYVRHGENPAGTAEFYIVHNVGALQEEDNQNGLAHFLEHMAFNGTKNYPDKGILEFLAKEGVSFGTNVNAYTSKAETVYNISAVPLVRETFVDSVLTVLHDWSCDISCEQKALDDERGVISEEWRRRDNLKNRVFERQSEYVYHGSKHTLRNVIGTLEIINGFTRDEILDFYHKWYRPDMQAIVVIGDFDPDAMVGKIRARFSDIPLAADRAQKQVYTAPEMTEPRFDYLLDEGINYYAFKVFHRQPFVPRESRADYGFYKDLYIRSIVSSVLFDRMTEAAKDMDNGVQRPVLVTNNHSADFYVSQFTYTLKDATAFPAAIRFYEQSVRRLREYGISQQEFDVAKLSVVKKQHLNASVDPSEVRNSDLVSVCVENFLRGFALVSPSELREMQKAAMDEITLEDVLPYIDMMFGTPEIVYCVSANISEQDKLPTEKQVKEILEASSAEKLEPSFLKYDSLDLSVSPVPGKVVSERKAKGHEGEDWVLSNGAVVHWTPMQELHSDTHLSMNIYYNTGYAAFGNENVAAAKYAQAFYKRHAGIRGIDRVAFANCPELLGISSSLSSGRRNSGLSITSNVAKLEDAFRLAYLQLTDPYLCTEDMLEKEKKASYSSLAKAKKKSMDLFNDEDRLLRYGVDPWRAELDSTALDCVDMELVRRMFDASFSSPSLMEVYIASDLDKEAVKGLVAEYIASIAPRADVVLSEYHSAAPVYKGRTVLDRTYPKTTEPKTSISYTWKTKVKQTPRNTVVYDILDYIMSARYLSLIREERGGTYTISFLSDYFADAPDVMESTVSFETRPEMKDVLVKDVEDVLASMAKYGPTASEMEDAVKYLAKRKGEVDVRNARSVTMTNSKSYDSEKYGVPFGYDYGSVVRSVKASDVRKAAAGVMRGDLLANIYTEE